AGALVVLAAVVLAAAAPALAPGDPIKNSLLDRLTPPTWGREHPLGTDTLGRDVASRLLHGARVSLVVCFSAVLLAGVVGVGRAASAEASLSFLGLGIPAAEPSWGAMLDEGRNYITTGWWLALFPGLAILVLVLGINLVGDWLRDVLDPRLERGL